MPKRIAKIGFKHFFKPLSYRTGSKKYNLNYIKIVLNKTCRQNLALSTNLNNIVTQRFFLKSSLCSHVQGFYHLYMTLKRVLCY